MADAGSRRWMAVVAVAAVIVAAGAHTNGAPIDEVETQIVDVPPDLAIAEEPITARTAGLGSAWDLPNLDHSRVEYWVARFDSVPEMRKKFQGFLDRGSTWAPVILEKLEARDMPRDLLYLAMIESGFNPAAHSHASAAGVWQFIAETGQRYGLAIDRAVDERRDPFRATDAALDYLQDLHDRFGSWYLAAAAYNSGENRVGRAMRAEFGRERAGTEQDYYRIWNKLPSETRDYVPLMVAAARITKDPRTYGFEPMDLRVLEWQEIVATPATPLIHLAERYGVSVAEIRELNPHFRIDRTPNNRQYAVRIPLTTTEVAQASAGIE